MICLRSSSILLLVSFAALANTLPQGYGNEDDDSGDTTAAIVNDPAPVIDDTGYTDNDDNDYDYEYEADAPAPEKVTQDDTEPTCSHEYFANQGFQCVPYYQCEDGEIVTDGAGLFDIRNGFGTYGQVTLDPENSKCEGYLEVCCRHPDYDDEPVQDYVFSTTTTTTETPKVHKRTTKATTTTTTPKPAPLKVYKSRCGRRNENGVGVNISNDPEGDGSTQFGEWPSMCAVLQKRTIGYEEINVYQCGGSLVAPGVIMTGAHCVYKLQATDLKVRCGEWDTRAVIEPKKHQDRDVEYVSVSPDFNNKTLFNDFALLYVDQDFKLARHLDVACLPEEGTGNVEYDASSCVATGWGKDRFGDKGKYQVILKQVYLEQKQRLDCQESLRTTRLGSNFDLDESFTCAGGEKGVDTCRGDGGGPLMCPVYRNNGNVKNYVQTGIVAWGIGCGKEGIPGVYADVTKGMCFMKLAHHCYVGDSIDNPFVAYNCQQWFENSVQKYEDEYAKQKEIFETAAKKRRQLKARGKMMELEWVLQNLAAFKNGCSSWSTAFESDTFSSAPYSDGGDQSQNQQVGDAYADTNNNNDNSDENFDVTNGQQNNDDGYVDETNQQQNGGTGDGDGYDETNQQQNDGTGDDNGDGYVDETNQQKNDGTGDDNGDGYVDETKGQQQNGGTSDGDGYDETNQQQNDGTGDGDGYDETNQQQNDGTSDGDGYDETNQQQNDGTGDDNGDGYVDETNAQQQDGGNNNGDGYDETNQQQNDGTNDGDGYDETNGQQQDGGNDNGDGYVDETNGQQQDGGTSNGDGYDETNQQQNDGTSDDNGDGYVDETNGQQQNGDNNDDNSDGYVDETNGQQQNSDSSSGDGDGYDDTNGQQQNDNDDSGDDDDYDDDQPDLTGYARIGGADEKKKE